MSIIVYNIVVLCVVRLARPAALCGLVIWDQPVLRQTLQMPNVVQVVNPPAYNSCLFISFPPFSPSCFPLWTGKASMFFFQKQFNDEKEVLQMLPALICNRDGHKLTREELEVLLENLKRNW